nr:lipopolysaccharide biosynthesis protein [Variovorax boronicumulans]
MERPTPPSSVVTPAGAVEGEATPSRLAEIKRRSVLGAVTTVGARMFTVLFSLASTAVLARLLAPEDFGLVAMVMSVAAFAGVFKDFGLSAAAVQAADSLTPAQASNLFWLNLAVGALLTLATMASAPLVGRIFDQAALVPVTVCMALSFLLASLGTQHAATLQRLLLFRRKAAADVAGALLSFGLSILLALQGYSYWALVWGTLAGTLATSLLLVALSPLPLQRPRLGQGVRHLLRFGGDVTAFEFVNYFHRNLDNVLIGRFWGAEALGLYSRAYQLLMFPINNLRAPINTVAFAAMSKLRGDPEQFRAYYRKVSFLLALTSMPVVAFLAVAAESVLALLLGPRWSGAVPIFQALALAGFIQPVASLRGLVALSSGRSRDYLFLGVINAVGVCLAFAVGLRWGPMGVAMAYSIAIYALLYPTVKLSFRSTRIRMSDFWSAIGQPACASVLGAAAVLMFPRVWLDDLPVVAALAAQAAVFVMAWLIGNVLWPGGWRALREVRALLRQLR